MARPAASTAPAEKAESAPLPPTNTFIDLETFDQILEMDDEGDDSFSKGIVVGFVDQAATTFEEMEKLITEKDLEQLSSRGHFLKGSSATLGLINIRDACEKIQHFGAKKDETGLKDLDDEEECLKRIQAIVDELKREYDIVTRYFESKYGDLTE